MSEDEIWSLEEGFWTAGPEHYETAMHPDCVMAFQAPVGIISGSRIVEALEGMPRWQAVSMKERQAAWPSAETVVIAYEASGERGRSSPYRAYCTSTYVRTADGWRLIQHQQTPL
jgi:hypothetical protein